MELKILDKLKEMNRITKVVWALLILFFVGILISHLTGSLNQIVLILGGAFFWIFVALLFVLIVAIFLGILGIRLKK